MSIVVTHVMIAHVTLVVHYSCASVWHWSRIVLCNRSRCRLTHVSIVRTMNSVVTTTVANEHCRMCIVEMPSVIVSVHCECPSASLPCYGAIEVVQCYILVILPRSQHEAEVCVTTIPPDAEDITVSVQAH